MCITHILRLSKVLKYGCFNMYSQCSAYCENTNILTVLKYEQWWN